MADLLTPLLAANPFSTVRALVAKRLGLGECDQLHHFIAAGVWDAVPVEAELLVQADRLVDGSDAVLVIDDTALPKKGTHSVGVAPGREAINLERPADVALVPVADSSRTWLRVRKVPRTDIPTLRTSAIPDYTEMPR